MDSRKYITLEENKMSYVNGHNITVHLTEEQLMEWIRYEVY